MANEGNKWWERRSQHGRALLFSSPHLMWEAACEYFKAEDEADYLTRTDIVGQFQGTAVRANVVCRVPYTWQGLCLYMGCATSYFRTRRTIWRKEIAEGINVEMNEDFLAVNDMIEATIFKQQYDNGQAGVFKEGLTSRYLRLADKSELSTPSEDEEFKVTLRIE